MFDEFRSEYFITKDDTAKTTKSLDELEEWFQQTIAEMKEEQEALKGRGERIEAEINRTH